MWIGEFCSRVNSYLVLEGSNDMKNHDIVPIPVQRRMWNVSSYISYWSIISLCMSTWSGAVALYDLGLNGAEAMGIVIVGNACITALAIFNSMFGSQYHIGYSVFQRIVWGVKGSWFGVLLRSLLSVVWFAAQAWLGGVCVNIVISTLSHNYLEMRTPLVGDTMDSQGLVGFIIFLILQLPLVFVRPEYFDFLLIASSVLTFAACVGITICCVRLNGGNGLKMTAPVELSGNVHAWRWIYGVGTWYSSLIAGLANQSDYSRFNRRPRDSYIGTIIGINISGVVVPLLALVCASAADQYFQGGTFYILPSSICLKLLEEDYSPKVRAGCFFAGLALVVSQLAMTTVANAIPGGMDLSTLFPRYINTRRGALLIFLLAWPAQPWTYLTDGNAFMAVMNSFSIFISPLLAIFVCEYFIIRKKIIKLSHCYVRGPGGIYWYKGGINFKAFLCFICGSAPGLPGLINSTNKNIPMDEGIINYYQGSFVFQFVTTFALYWALNFIWPSKVGERDDVDYFNTFTPQEREAFNMEDIDGHSSVDLEDKTLEISQGKHEAM